jgi:hypothetical protein
VARESPVCASFPLRSCAHNPWFRSVKRLTASVSPLSLRNMPGRTSSKKQNLAPYAARWVALVHGAVIGVGWTAEEARRAAKRSRPKEEPQVVFVPAVEMFDDEDPAA